MMNLFEYTDYRTYLRNFYLAQKEKQGSYSYRVFALRAKLSSPNYLKLVIDGKRRITDKTLPQFVRGLKLNRQETEYFRHLVLYQETHDPETKNNSLSEMIRIRQKSASVTKILDPDHLSVMSHWYHWAIREMVLLEDFSPDPKWIASRLHHRITPKQADESLRLLKRTRFLHEEKGKYRQNEPLISTSDEIASLLIRKLHQQFIEIGVDSLFNDPVEKREVSGLTLALPQGKIGEVKMAIKEFRRDLNRIFSTQEKTGEVYQLVINFFPLTK
ncbi:MAG: TIGR02147 family protein [Deltaproteobacteria bacterium]|nr:TIGR02147 family protein [Deltaproteobacteria bacterium]